MHEGEGGESRVELTQNYLDEGCNLAVKLTTLYVNVVA